MMATKSKTKKYDNNMKEFLKVLGEGLLQALGQREQKVLSPFVRDPKQNILPQPPSGGYGSFVQPDGSLPGNPELNAQGQFMPPAQGNFGRVTYYSPTETPAYDVNGIKQMLTRTGTNPKPGYTAAVSPNMLREQGGSLRMGDLVQVGDRTYRIEDVTNESIKDTLDVYRHTPEEGEGLKQNVPFRVTGRDTKGLKYNFKE